MTRKTDILGPRLGEVFRLLLHLNSFPVAGDWTMSPQFLKVHFLP